MTPQEQIKLLLKFEDSLNENDLDIEVIKTLSRVRSKILAYEHPIFTENGIPVMEHWEEFKYTGLHCIDFINTEFYKEGFA